MSFLNDSTCNTWEKKCWPEIKCGVKKGGCSLCCTSLRLPERQAEVQFRQKETTLDQGYDGVNPAEKGFGNASVDEDTQRWDANKKTWSLSLFLQSVCKEGTEPRSACGQCGFVLEQKPPDILNFQYLSLLFFLTNCDMNKTYLFFHCLMLILIWQKMREENFGYTFRLFYYRLLIFLWY